MKQRCVLLLLTLLRSEFVSIQAFIVRQGRSYIIDGARCLHAESNNDEITNNNIIESTSSPPLPPLITTTNPREITSLTTDTTTNTTTTISVLLCPAQFCVPADYDTFLDNLKAHLLLQRGSTNNNNNIRLGYSVTAPLSRTDWIKVARQLPTKEFFLGKLPVEVTLRWYFQAIEQGLAEILANNNHDSTTRICIVGHSIGGWVARAYLAGFSQSSTAIGRLVQQGKIIAVSSLVTLGTPHIVSKNGLVDQTRGLVTAINAVASSHPRAFQQRGISVTCVASGAILGKINTFNIQQLIAASSYGPLSGNWTTVGDGIVPLDLAFLEDPAERVIVDSAEHIHVLPTPWNLWDGKAPSIPLNLDSYFGTEAMAKWTKYIC